MAPSAETSKGQVIKRCSSNNKISIKQPEFFILMTSSGNKRRSDYCRFSFEETRELLNLFVGTKRF